MNTRKAAFRQRSPFGLAPWHSDFLSGLLDLALADSAAGKTDLSDALFVFPHARPARYLERLISLDRRLPKPCPLPEILPVHQLFEALRGEFLPPAATVSRLDQIGLLLECVRAEQADNPGEISALPTADAKAFFPWGGRLADLFEDCFTQAVQPANFLYLDEELTECAALLLNRLGNLHRRYLEALDARNWTTGGLTAFRVAEKIRALPAGGELGSPFQPGRPVYLAGFYSPNGCEDVLFRRLWSEGRARVIVQGDPALTRQQAHWSCDGLEKWRSAWGAAWETLAGPAEEAARPQIIKYYSGYDLHSQLRALREIRAGTDGAGEMGENGGNSALILPDTELLLPVLHSLRHKDLNVSMGYPLDKSALNQLLESILALQENRRAGGYYWKDCIQLIRHPYIKMLSPASAAPGLGWRAFLHDLEKNLREANRRYLDFTALARQTFLSRDPAGDPEAGPDEAPGELPGELLEEFCAACLEAWRDLRNLGELAAALDRLCSFLTARGEELWPRFPIDAECLYRFRQYLGPDLSFSALRGETLPPETLFAILRGLIREERVPFEAYPLTAAQILGLLESRLLSFERVFILEATDDLLPGGAHNDPLLPDSLRREIGLPDIFRKQRLTAYYFFRLLAGAREAHIFWKEGAAGGLFDDKKIRSRFVEELLWREEKKLGRLLEAEDGAGSPLRRLSGALRAPAVARRRLPPAVAAPAGLALAHKFSLAEKSVSAGKMNAFLTCPLAFHYRELAGLQPLRDIADGEDPAETGEFLHDVFYRHYSPKLGDTLDKDRQSRAELNSAFHGRLAESRLAESFPQDALAGLRALAPLRLGRYLREQPPLTRIVALETSAKAELRTPDGRRFLLAGRLDRIDERVFPGREIVFAQSGELAPESAPATEAEATGLVILDYKSGRVAPPPPEFWTASPLWPAVYQAAAGAREPGAPPGELLAALADALNGNVQLPLYLYLLRHGRLDPEAGKILPGLTDFRAVRNAAWIDLGGDGKEKPLLPEMLPEEALAEILDRKIPALLTFLLNEMAAGLCAARPGRHCDYCAYIGLCRVTEQDGPAA